MKTQLKSGRQTLINIWATWCIPCAAEMPELEKIRSELSASGIDLIGLNVDAEKDANIKGYLSSKRISYPNLIGGIAAIEKIYATDELTVPLTILVDEKGIVKELIPGWSKETEARFAELIGRKVVEKTKINR